MSAPAKVAPQTIIADGKCRNCGAEVDVKVNRNGCAYYYCTGGQIGGEWCAHHERFGKATSRGMVKRYLEEENAPTGTSPANVDAAPIRAANDNAAPAADEGGADERNWLGI